MYVCETNNDTTIAITSTTNPNQFEINKTSTNYVMPVVYSLAISVMILLIISYLKYHMDKNNNGCDYWQFFLELPIDLGNIAISVLVAYHYMVHDVKCVVIAILIELFMMLICMTMRNKAILLLYEDTISVWKIFLFVSIEFILSVGTATFIFILILQ